MIEEEEEMKRLFSLILAVVLVLSVACAAAAEGVTFTTQYFTLQLPDNWETDYEDLQKEDDEEDLGYFYDTAEIGLVGAAFLVYYEQLKDISLFNENEETIQEYIDAITEELEEYKPQYLETVTAVPDAGMKAIPIVLFKVADDEGDFIYADTITNGYSIQFEFYVTDAEGEKMYPITDEYIELIKTILATLKPAA